MTAPAPSPTPRILALDALRGLAVIGIVGMNVHAFALPGPAYYNPLSYGATSPLDYWVWLASFVFIEDKFRTLFAMLFGAGCLILIERSGAAPWRAHYGRMAVLLVIGLAHATLLASNDVLRAYALAGMALPLLAGLSARALINVALGLLLVHVALGLVALGAPLVAYHVGQGGMMRCCGQSGSSAAMRRRLRCCLNRAERVWRSGWRAAASVFRHNLPPSRLPCRSTCQLSRSAWDCGGAEC